MATSNGNSPSRSPQIVGPKGKNKKHPNFSTAAEEWLESRQQYTKKAALDALDGPRKQIKKSTQAPKPRVIAFPGGAR